MKTPRATPPPPPRRTRTRRGSVLIVAMLLASIIGISLVSYIKLSTNSLKLAHRSFFANAGNNLVEAGLEEAVYSFNLMGSGTAVATVWSTANGWTTNSAANTATRTLPTFTLDQNATGIIKIYVSGYDGTNAAPVVVAQSTITPFDGGAPIVKIVEVTLRFNGPFANGVVAKNGMTWNGQPTADSWLSNPTSSTTGPWSTYPGTGARANTTVADLTGTVDLGSQGIIRGSLALGSAATYTGSNTITGTTTRNFSSTLAMPVYPTAASLDHYTNLGATIPATIPSGLDQPNTADGRYYFFAVSAAISTTIAANKNVTIIGSGSTNVSGTVTLPSTSTLIVYTDGTINGTFVNNAWAGALQLYTTTTSATTINGNQNITACIYAPNSPITGNGGGSTGAFYGSFVGATVTSNGHMDFHYDESLRTIGGSKPWALNLWRELQSATERASYATQLNF